MGATREPAGRMERASGLDWAARPVSPHPMLPHGEPPEENTYEPLEAHQSQLDPAPARRPSDHTGKKSFTVRSDKRAALRSPKTETVDLLARVALCRRVRAIGRDKAKHGARAPQRGVGSSSGKRPPSSRSWGRCGVPPLEGVAVHNVTARGKRVPPASLTAANRGREKELYNFHK